MSTASEGANQVESRRWRQFIPLIIIGCLAFRESYVVTSGVESYKTRPAARRRGDEEIETLKSPKEPGTGRQSWTMDGLSMENNDTTTKESSLSIHSIIVGPDSEDDDSQKVENLHSNDFQDFDKVSLSTTTRDDVRSIENIASADASPGKRKRRKDRRSKGESGTTARESIPLDREEHKCAIFIVHYHKTGYVLSRELKNLVRVLESEAAYPDMEGKRFSGFKHFQSGLDDETGKRFAFDQYGNWPRSAFQTRNHRKETNLPNRFDMSPASLYVQESPDIFADDSAVLENMNTAEGGTKIIHFVRNPFEMVLSNYFYHSAVPTPEKWVHTGKPCVDTYEGNATLSSHIVPTLRSYINGTDLSPSFLDEVDGIMSLCNSLFRSRAGMENATLYEHLLQLDRLDGLRLATAHMAVASSESVKHLAGGDILRMANNIVRFEGLVRAAPDKIHVKTVAMGDFIGDTQRSIEDFFDFIFGEDNKHITEELKKRAAISQVKKYEKKTLKSNHVTQGNSDDKRIKADLRHQLVMDPILGPLLNFTEILVNSALSL